MIKFADVSKDYAIGGIAVPALRNVTFSIAAGEFVAVMGPSGSGKSTMMNLIGFLDTPTSGRYFFEGADVSHLDQDALAHARNAKIGFVFQSFNLLPRLTARENVELPLIYARVSAHHRRQRALELLAMVGLGDRVDHRPTQLSGGQQQRVAIARALANRPLLLLADEPTGALDTQSSEEILRILQDLHRQGMTVVLITHERDVACLAGRLITLRDGRVISDSRDLAGVA